MKTLPELHTQAFKYKNLRKLQHDGGRAWIKNPHTHEAIKDANKVMEINEKAPKN
jgi:hypothetical protein